MTVYAEPAGQTPAQTLAFYRQHKAQLGEIVEAYVYEPRAPRYTASLRDLDGNWIELRGVHAGGHGPESRAALTILRDAGFPLFAAHAVLRRGVKLYKPLPEQVALEAGMPWAIRDPWHYRARQSLALHSQRLISRAREIGR